MLRRRGNEESSGAVLYDYRDSFRCCGIRYNKWILTSGLILCPYIPHDDIEICTQTWDSTSEYKNDWDSRKLDFVNYLKNKVNNKKIKVLVENGVDHCTRIVSDKNMLVASKEFNNNNAENVLVSRTTYLLTAFRSLTVNQYVVDHFTDWQLCTKQEQFDYISFDLIQNLLSLFVILQMDDEDNTNIITPVRHFMDLCSSGQNVHRGENIIVESSPFTIQRFYNSWSKGIISNSVGNSDCLFFTDTRLVIGCVGAPVYRYRQSRKGGLIGMILNPMMWSQGGWSGFSVAVNLYKILSEVLQERASFIKAIGNKDFNNCKLIDNLDKSVVLVRCGSNWGSGVIVNTKLGVIMTCAHVVNYGKENVLSIVCGDYQANAHVVYSSKPGEVFDLAVIKTNPLLKLKALSFANNAPDKGETVYCVGFPVIDTGRVTVSKGVLSNMVPNVLIQTTCCVECGASGGAIINYEGCLIGIPVSNVSCGTTNALYSHCNLVVPTTAFANALLHFFKTNDSSSLKSITTTNPNTIKAWSLQEKCKI